MKKKIFLVIVLSTLFGISYSDAQNDKSKEDELLALQYYNAGEYEKAVQIYERLFRRTPSMYIYNYYYECLYALKEYEKAEKIIQNQIKKNPLVFRFQVDLGMIYFAVNDIKKAEKAFSGAISTLHPAEENYSSLAQYFIFRNYFQWAIKTYEAGISKIPFSVLMRYELADLYFRTENYEQIFKIFYWLLDNTMISISDGQQRLLTYFSSSQTRTIADEFVGYALMQSQRNPQNTVYSEMLIWAYLQIFDYTRAIRQAIATDRRQKADGEIVLSLMPVLISNKEFETATEGLTYVIDKGEKSRNYYNARIILFEVNYLKSISVIPANVEHLKELEKDLKEFITEVGIHLNTVSLIQQLAKIQAFYLDKQSEASKLIEKTLEMPGVKGLLEAELKILLADIKLLTGEHWDASLLYSQVEKDFKHDTIGYRAKYKNALFYYYIGEIDYALIHLKILRAGISKFIANDALELSLFISNNIDADSSYVPLFLYSRAEFLWKCGNTVSALNTLDTLLNTFSGHPISDDAFFLKAKIYYQMKNYDNAVENLNAIIRNHYLDLIADDALFMIADIYHNNINDYDKAMKCYMQLIEDFPSSGYVQDSRNNYRKLRNKQINP